PPAVGTACGLCQCSDLVCGPNGACTHVDCTDGTCDRVSVAWIEVMQCLVTQLRAQVRGAPREQVAPGLMRRGSPLLHALKRNERALGAVKAGLGHARSRVPGRVVRLDRSLRRFMRLVQRLRGHRRLS